MSSNKTYLITGANRGIGKAFVSLLLQRPSTTVVAAVRDPSNDTSKALASLPKGDGSKLILVKIDSSVESDPAAAIQQIQQEHGVASLDVVIANAGISHSNAPARSVSFDAALDHFKVNSVAPLVLFGAAAPLLKSGSNPVFVAVSSAVGSIAAQEDMSRAFPGIDLSPYGASKAAVNWFVQRLHVEEPWLTSFVFHPGLVETDMGSLLSKKTGIDMKSLGAVTTEQSVSGMVAVLDGATRETSGKFKKYDGTDFPW